MIGVKQVEAGKVQKFKMGLTVPPTVLTWHARPDKASADQTFACFSGVPVAKDAFPGPYQAIFII